MVLVLPASVIGYMLVSLVGLLLAWISMWMGNNLSLWWGTESTSIDLFQFMQASDFSGTSYFAGIWYLFLIRLPASAAFFLIPTIFFPNHNKIAFYSVVTLYVILLVVYTIILVLRYDNIIQSTDELIRAILEVCVIPIIVIYYIYNYFLKDNKEGSIPVN